MQKESLLGSETTETSAAAAEAPKEDLSKLNFFQRLGKKQFWEDVGKAIKTTAETGVESAKEGFQSLVKKDTWVGDNGAFGKDTWKPVGENVKEGFEDLKSKETWVGDKGAFGTETWAGKTGVFGSNNRDQAKSVFDKVFFSTEGGGAAPAEDSEAIEEKKRMALAMLKEGQISQEEYDRLIKELNATATDDGAAAAAPAGDTRSRVDTADL